MIDSYKFGEIIINGKPYGQDVIIYKDRVDSSWWRKEGHQLCIDDIKDIIIERPKVLIIGTGAYETMKVLPEVKTLLIKNKLELIVLSTEEACKKYNSLISEGKEVVAALHLTC